VANNHAEWMLERDINNMRDYFGQFAPELLTTQYAKEIWEIYESGKLTPDTELTGHFDEPTESADVDAVMSEIQEAFKEEQERLARMQSADED
jgi:RIO kinase 1